METILFNIRRIVHRASAEKLRYDLIGKTFGEMALLDTFPPVSEIEAATSNLDSALRQEWRRAMAEELLLRYMTGRRIQDDWRERFAHVQPFDREERTLNHCIADAAACCVFPLANSGRQPGVGHVWVFQGGRHAFTTTAPNREWQGSSWQLAAELARIALRSGDRKHIETLATRWIVTGTCENGRIGPVEIGNKLELDTRRQWIVPASLSLPDESVNKPIFRAATTESAFGIVTGQGFQRDSDLTLPHSADVLHSFVSSARLPVLLTALAVRPKRIILWVSDKSVKEATDLKECLLPYFLPDVEIDQRPVDSRELEEVGKALRPVLGEQARCGETVVFNLTNGNFIQKLAATGIAANYPDIFLVYRDHDDENANLTTLSYRMYPPQTCPNVPSGVDGARINLHRLTDYDTGKTCAEELLSQLMPEKN